MLEGKRSESSWFITYYVLLFVGYMGLVITLPVVFIMKLMYYSDLAEEIRRHYKVKLPKAWLYYVFFGLILQTVAFALPVVYLLANLREKHLSGEIMFDGSGYALLYLVVICLLIIALSFTILFMVNLKYVQTVLKVTRSEERAGGYMLIFAAQYLILSDLSFIIFLQQIIEKANRKYNRQPVITGNQTQPGQIKKLPKINREQSADNGPDSDWQ